MLGENRWLASTARFAYLVDGEETVLGEISEAEMTGKFFYKNGKIFDSDLELIYDCASNKMTLVDVLDGAFLLKNYDGEIFCYTGGEGKPEKIITKKEAKTSEVTVLDSGLFVVCDRSNPADVNYDFYNAEGEKIFSTDAIAGCNINPDDVIRTESAVLVPYNINGVYAYYKIR